MSFYALSFLPLLVVSLCIYYVFAGNKSIQNVVLIAASLIFYGFGHVHYLAILGGISLFTFFMGLLMEYTNKKVISIIGISSIVLFFILMKYSGMGFDLIDQTTLSIVLGDFLSMLFDKKLLVSILQSSNKQTLSTQLQKHPIQPIKMSIKLISKLPPYFVKQRHQSSVPIYMRKMEEQRPSLTQQ